MTKKLTSLMLALVMCLSLCVSAFAAEAAPSANDANTVIDLTTAGYFDSETPLTVFPRISVNTNAPKLGNGEYRYYFNSDGTDFTISPGTTVRVSIQTDINSSLKIGYVKTGSSNVQSYSQSNRTSHSTSIYLATGGTYKIWIYNAGSDSFKVTGGSIEF